MGDIRARVWALLVGLAVAAVIGTDAFVAWLGELLPWERQNAFIARPAGFTELAAVDGAAAAFAIHPECVP